MTPEYTIPSFLGQTEPTRDQNQKRAVHEARAYVTDLVRQGILHPDFIRQVQETETTNHIITFSNMVEGNLIYATITLKFPPDDTPDSFVLRVYVPSKILYEEDETLSVSSGNDLEKLIERGKSMMLIYKKADRKDDKKVKTSLLQVRIEEDLKSEFEKACADADESQARVIRKLIKYYLGQGPDPKLSK